MCKKIYFILSFILVFALSSVAQQSAYNWQLAGSDSLYGMQVFEALEILKGKEKHEVVVALIDTGVDINHPDLKNAIWINKGEIAENNTDDDSNGYLDDINGWNFLGTPDNSFNLTNAGIEAFREYKRLRPRYKELNEPPLDPEARREYLYYKSLETQARIPAYLTYTAYLSNIAVAFETCDSLIRLSDVDYNTLTVANLVKLTPKAEDSVLFDSVIYSLTNPLLLAGKDAYWKEVYKTNTDNYRIAKARVESLDDPLTDPRLKIGDNPEDFADLYYGNKQIAQYDGGRGTVLAGLIAAQGNNAYGIRGVFPDSRLMVIRALPSEGEEYDKDIATAIRYAVDNGADIINIGFCKTISPFADQVSQALDYAARKNVLIIRAAGDKSLNLDTVLTFPSLLTAQNKRYRNIIVVGASTPDGMPTPSSNYGKEYVDVYAPGTKLYSTYPNKEYGQFEESSLSSALVCGMAALLKAYYPNLDASRIRELIIHTVRPMPQGDIKKKEGILPTSEMSLSGGIVNAKNLIEYLMNNK